MSKLSPTQQTITVILPTFNGVTRGFIDQSIESILSQSYPATEIIVVDDGSSDNTGEYLRNKYPQLKIISQKNGGPSNARNTGIAHASGDFIAFIDDDDLWLEDKLKLQVEFLTIEENSDCGMVATGYYRQNSGVTQLVRDTPSTALLKLPELFFFNSIGTSSTPLIRKSVIDLVGGFNEQLRFAEDQEYWIRIARSSRIGVIETPLGILRRHSMQFTHNLIDVYDSSAKLISLSSASPEILAAMQSYVTFDHFFKAIFRKRPEVVLRIIASAKKKYRVDIFIALFFVWFFRKVPSIKNFFRKISIKLVMINAPS